jgi:hypothetical protein
MSEEKENFLQFFLINEIYNIAYKKGYRDGIKKIGMPKIITIEEDYEDKENVEENI